MPRMILLGIGAHIEWSCAGIEQVEENLMQVSKESEGGRGQCWPLLVLCLPLRMPVQLIKECHVGHLDEVHVSQPRGVL